MLFRCKTFRVYSYFELSLDVEVGIGIFKLFVDSGMMMQKIMWDRKPGIECHLRNGVLKLHIKGKAI